MVWHIRGYRSEGRAWLERVLQHSTSAAAPTQAKLLYGAGRFQSDLARANMLIEQALACGGAERQAGHADALLFLDVLTRLQRDYERSGKLIQRAWPFSGRKQITWGVVLGLLA